MVACETTLPGAWAYACSKTMLSPARRSRFGVSAPLAPRKPMRSARVEQRVINTRLGLDAAAAKEKLIKIRLTPAINFRIMTVSVEGAPALIKTSTPRIYVHATPRTIYVPAPRDFQSHGDVVITTPSLARKPDHISQ